MERQPDLRPDWKVITDRLVAADKHVQDARDVLREAAKQVDQNGKPSDAAKKAKAQLRNPEGNTTRLSQVIKSMMGPDGAAKKVKLLEERNDAVEKLNQAVFNFVQSETAYYAFETLSSIYQQEAADKPSRKREKNSLQSSAEAARFIERLTERETPIYILDQLTEGEMDMLSAMFAEKAGAAKHGIDSAWGRAFQGGFLEVTVEDMTDDQRAAILAARGKIDEDAGEIYRTLCEITGRELNISPAFAASVFALMSDEYLGPGVSANLKTAAAAQLEADARRVMELLGLGEEERSRALDLLDPIRVRWAEGVALAQAEREKEELAIESLARSYEPFVVAALDEVFEAERTWERNLVEASTDDSYDGDRIYKKILELREAGQMPGLLEGYPDLIWQVLGQRFLSESERRRARQVAEYARDFVENGKLRERLRQRGKSMPEPDQLNSLDPPVARSVAHPILTTEHPAIALLGNPIGVAGDIRTGSAECPTPGRQEAPAGAMPLEGDNEGRPTNADKSVVIDHRASSSLEDSPSALNASAQGGGATTPSSASSTPRPDQARTLSQVLKDAGRAAPLTSDLPFDVLTFAAAIRVGEQFWSWDRPELSCYFEGTTVWTGLTGSKLIGEISDLKKRGEANREQLELLAASGSDHGRAYLAKRRRELAEGFVERLLDGDLEAWDFAKAYSNLWF